MVKLTYGDDIIFINLSMMRALVVKKGGAELRTEDGTFTLTPDQTNTVLDVLYGKTEV